ncbi:unnamed protein product, partial [Ilex paraguariensis]
RNFHKRLKQVLPQYVVQELEKEIPTCVEDEDFFKDIQDVYDQLYVQFLKQQENVFSLNGWVNLSEEETRAPQVHLVKSNAQICGLEDENKSLLDRVNFLEKECHELLKSKKNLESKYAKLDKDFQESNKPSKRLPQCDEKFDRMLSIGQSVGDKRGLGYTNEYTNISSKTVFVKGITNPSPPQGSTSPKMTSNGKGRNSKKKVLNETQNNCVVGYTCGEHGHYITLHEK